MTMMKRTKKTDNEQISARKASSLEPYWLKLGSDELK